VDGAQPDAKNYPLARPLYYLTNGSKPLSPIAQQFVDFSLSPEGQEIVKRVHFLSIN
jgi:phosphate transport system substrate-binding protein